MKRREFLKILSQSAAGLSLPSAAYALCPPTRVQVDGVPAGGVTPICAVAPPTEYPGVVVSDFEGLPLPGSTSISSPLAKPLHVGHSQWSPLYWHDSDTVFVSDISPRSGTRCALFRLDRDEPVHNAYFNLDSSQENERTELRWLMPSNIVTSQQSTPAGDINVASQDTWMGFSVFVPADWQATFLRDARTGLPDFSRNRGGIITQWHHDVVKASDTEWNPPCSISISGSPASAAAIPTWQTRASYNRFVPALEENTVDRTTNLRSIAIGSWTDWVVQLRYHPFTGYMRFWVRDANSGGNFVLHSEYTGGVGYSKTTNKP
jgi:hypothetical protein